MPPEVAEAPERKSATGRKDARTEGGAMIVDSVTTPLFSPSSWRCCRPALPLIGAAAREALRGTKSEVTIGML